MSDETDSWRTFNEEPLPADPFIDREVRSIVIGFVIQIVDRFMMTTTDVLTPMTSTPRRVHPAGAESYCLEDWLEPGIHDFDVDANFSYYEAFGASWDPLDQAIVDFLAAHDLKLRDPKDASCFHRAWIGRAARRCAGSLLIGLMVPDLEQDPSLESQMQAEFVRLAPLLDRRLDAKFCRTLIMALFWLSKTLALAELERPHRGIVPALLEAEASLLRHREEEALSWRLRNT